MYLAPSDDVVAPVVRSAAVASFANGVGRTDALARVSVAVVPYVVALTSCGSRNKSKFQLN